MKKFFLLGLLLLTACLNVTSEPSVSPEPTYTRLVPTQVVATVTPTGTKSPTPSPVGTQTPIPPERYFTEEFEIPPIYWSALYASGDPSRVEILNKDGALTFELYAPITWVYAIYGAFEYESVHTETRVMSRGSQMNSIGLVCHYDEQDGWYEFNIFNDGTYNLLYGQWLAEEIARYTPILNDTSERIEVGNATNEIGLDCYENIVQFYINGKPIRKLNVEHIGLTGGKVGLSLASFEEAPVILSFDWVEVSQIAPP